jgi:hypothetical protein
MATLHGIVRKTGGDRIAKGDRIVRWKDGRLSLLVPFWHQSALSVKAPVVIGWRLTGQQKARATARQTWRRQANHKRRTRLLLAASGVASIVLAPPRLMLPGEAQRTRTSEAARALVKRARPLQALVPEDKAVALPYQDLLDCCVFG